MLDKTIQIPTPIDLSGAAISGQVLYLPKIEGRVSAIHIYITETTSADASVRVWMGSSASSAKYLDIPAISSTLVSKAAGTVITYAIGTSSEGINSVGAMLAGERIILSCSGGKAGTGEFLVFLELAEFGG